MKLGVIFDMDGTLWDSSEGVAKAWSEVVIREYPERGEITTKEIQQVMGLTMVRIAEILFDKLPEKDRLELLNHCCEYENEYLLKNGGILYPGLEDTWKKLQENYHLYIVSNCQKGYIEAFLEHYGFAHYFDDIECYGNNDLPKADNIKLLAERNKLDDAVYVGDIQGDYDAATKAGFHFIHAVYGFGKITEKVPEISTFSQLPEVLTQIWPGRN